MRHFDFNHFFVEPADVLGDSFVLRGEEAKHAARVMRKVVGDELRAVDGKGGWYRGDIVSMDKQSVVVGLRESKKEVGEPQFQLTLAQAIPKGNRFDVVVEKGTEIGISTFQPIITQHSIVEGSARTDRWRHKALAAMKQCGRSRVPQFYEPVPFKDYLRQISDQDVFIAHTLPTPAAPPTPSLKQAVIFIGPEGGFSEFEIDHALEMGASILDLGARRLRSETAGLIGAAKLLMMANEL